MDKTESEARRQEKAEQRRMDFEKILKQKDKQTQERRESKNRVLRARVACFVVSRVEDV